jgi:hypothetical protein
MCRHICLTVSGTYLSCRHRMPFMLGTGCWGLAVLTEATSDTIWVGTLRASMGPPGGVGASHVLASPKWLPTAEP